MPGQSREGPIAKLEAVVARRVQGIPCPTNSCSSAVFVSAFQMMQGIYNRAHCKSKKEPDLDDANTAPRAVDNPSTDLLLQKVHELLDNLGKAADAGSAIVKRKKPSPPPSKNQAWP